MSDWKTLGFNPHLIRCPICAAALIDEGDERAHLAWHALQSPLATNPSITDYSDKAYQNEMRRG